jgi:hypothetical protein
MGELSVDLDILPIVFADGTIEGFSQQQELALSSKSVFTSLQTATHPVNDFLIRGINSGSLDGWMPESLPLRMSHGFNYECEVSATEVIGLIVYDLLSVLTNSEQGVEYWETYLLLNVKMDGYYWSSKILSNESIWKWLRENIDALPENCNEQEITYLLEMCAKGNDVRQEYQAETVEALKSSNFRKYFNSV